MKPRKKIRRVKCRCGKIPYYSEDAAEYHLKLAQKKSFLDKDRKECRIYLCEINTRDKVWHLTSMTEQQHFHRTVVWARATVWTYGVRGMPSIKLKPEQMRGTANRNPWHMRVIVRVIIRKRKQE